MEKWKNPPVWVRERVPLAGLTSWRIGGTARYFAEPAGVEELRMLLAAAEAPGLPVYALGGGSNLLITDGVLDGLVVKLPATGEFAETFWNEDEPTLLRAGAACPLPALLERAAELGLSGLEDLAGIPGTVGGAVMMNAGGTARGVGAYVDELRGVGAGGREAAFSRDQLHFAYRFSNLDDIIISEATFRLRLRRTEEIRADMRNLAEMKRSQQPVTQRSAGCVFKNPRVKPAGMLIDQAGLKGFRVGDAEVSRMHANFIVNSGKATCEQVRRVIDHVRREVARVHRVELDLEVEMWI